MPDSLTQQISEKLHDLIDIIAVYSSKNEILLKGSPKYDLRLIENECKSRLASYGSSFELISTDPYLLVRLRPAETAKGRFPWVNIILFLTTGATTILTGALWEGVDWISDPLLILKNPFTIIYGGLPFSLSLLAILGFHEFGHYFAARYHGVNVTLPYFIPAPPAITLIGTFGAFIKSRSAFINRRQLLDVGAAGPLAGLVIAVIVLAIGINNSTIQPMSDEFSGIFFGESLLFKFLTYLIKGPVEGDYVLVISSVGFAGWVGILVTMFNLLPMGQLDGGHIAYALFGKLQKTVALGVILILVALSFYWQGWLVWIFIGLLLKLKHPPTVMDEIPLGKGRQVIGLISILAFIICFIPSPIYFDI
jgi:membrane-associated protease RseP (regulator of RpoE activity)